MTRPIQPPEKVIVDSRFTEETRRKINEVIGIIDGTTPITPQLVEVKDLSEIVNPQLNVFYLYQKDLVYWDGTEFVVAGSNIFNVGTPMIQLNVGVEQDVDDNQNQTILNFVSSGDIKDSEFTHVDGTSQIITNSGGRIEVEGFVTVFGQQGNYRFTVRTRVLVNGDDGNRFIDGTYIRSASGSNESSMIFKRTIDNVPPGATIQLSSIRISNTAGNATTVVGGCCVTIKKL